MTITKLNPATLELVGVVEETTLDRLPTIIQRARRAQEEWSGWPLERRAEVLKAVRDRLRVEAETIARTICQETGKPRLEAMNADVLASLTAADFAIRSMRSLFAPRKVSFQSMDPMMRYMGRRSYIRNRPLGVVGIITPWNYPLGIPFSQTVMALAAGNAVIFKPSPESPLTAIAMARLFEGLVPTDLLQLVVGGDDHGRAVVTSGVDRLIFTGSPAAGQSTMALASTRLTPLTLELGGKDPFVVLNDADLSRAADGVVWGSFVNAGQTCVCVKRVYVQAEAYDRFLDMITERVGKLRIGYDWDDPEIDMGPLISEEAVEISESMVHQAVRDGGKVLTGGKRVTGREGHFFEPTVIVDVPHSSTAVQEESFGPIITVHRFTSDEDAVRLANDCRYALSASVWSADLPRAQRIAERIASGTVIINNVAYTYGLAMTPWGGKGMSGFGRTHGDLGFAELVEPHHVHVDKGRFPREYWWYPYGKGGLDAGRDMMELIYGSTVGKMAATLRLRKFMKGR